MTHKEQILSYLKAGNKITQERARELFGCWRLGARIYDLKRDGHPIASEMIATPGGAWVARYELRAD